MLNSPLPFDIYDPVGKLLVPRRTVIRNSDDLQRLQAHVLMVEAEATVEWRQKVAGSIDVMVRQNNVSLKSIASLNPEVERNARREAPPVERSFAAEIGEVQMHAAVLLREGAHVESNWLTRIQALCERVALLATRDADAALYLLVQATLHESERYSSDHALLCVLVSDLVLRQLRWPDRAGLSLRGAALTMNVAMTSLQNMLAHRDAPPTPDQRRLIDSHPARAAELLRAIGLDDEVWLGLVETHHEGARQQFPLAELTPTQRLNRVLHRVDVFTAKISPRARRAGLAAPLAARDACLGADGQPDEVGAALIKALGIYPPGSYVKLASDEVAVVMQRGAHASRPRVVSIVNREGHPLGVPAVRDTRDRRHEIRGSVPAAEVRVRLQHERMLALI